VFYTVVKRGMRSAGPNLPVDFGSQAITLGNPSAVILAIPCHFDRVRYRYARFIGQCGNKGTPCHFWHCLIFNSFRFSGTQRYAAAVDRISRLSLLVARQICDRREVILTRQTTREPGAQPKATTRQTAREPGSQPKKASAWRR
jgi:hypothetical protein